MDMNISHMDHYEWEQAKTAVIGEDSVPDTLARQGRYKYGERHPDGSVVWGMSGLEFDKSMYLCND